MLIYFRLKILKCNRTRFNNSATALSFFCTIITIYSLPEGAFRVFFMLDIITKKDLFEWLEKDYLPKDPNNNLKLLQDGFILSRLGNCLQKKIVEIGGGNSRILGKLIDKNECWNIDKFEGIGNGPTKIEHLKGVKTIKAYMGEFCEQIPNNYFDVAFSVSVIEHIQNEDDLRNMFLDIKRVLKDNGVSYHAIDASLKENPDMQPNRYVSKRLMTLLEIIQESGFTLIQDTALNIDQIAFKCSYATLSDLGMWSWSKIVKNDDFAFNRQVVSIKLAIKKGIVRRT